MPQALLNIRTDGQGRQWISAGELQETLFGPRRTIPSQELSRRYFGSTVSPEIIESVLNAATMGGHMQGLADLESETLSTDPTFASIVQKRTSALASVDVQVVPASGDEVDDGRAKLYAKQLTQELAGIRDFRARITSLSWAHFCGRAALEKDWTENAGGTKPYQWSLTGLNWIHSRRLSFGPARELRVRDSAYSGGGFESRGLDIEAIPHKFITFTPQLFDEYPEREGYGPRGLYWSFFKRFTESQRNQLLELFGLPWRIAETSQPYDAATLDEIQERVDKLGSNASIALPAGVTVRTEQPDPKSTEAHKANIELCNQEISRLVLWSTRTMDSAPSGLGSADAAVHQDGETLAISGDGWRISELLTYELSRDWVGLNYGEAEQVNAPKIVLNYSIPENKTERTNRLVAFLGTGAQVIEAEAYEATGFTVPQPGDAVIQAQAQDLGGSVAAPLAMSQAASQTANRALRLLRLNRQSSS